MESLHVRTAVKLFVKVKIKAKQEKVQKLDNKHYVVYTKAVPEKGKANEAVIKLLSDYFSTPKSYIQIIRGGRSREKVVLVG